MPLRLWTCCSFGGCKCEDLFENIDGLLRITLVFRCIGAGNVLLSVGGGQIEAGIEKAGIQRDGILEVFNRVFVVGVLIGLHALIELVARSQLGAAQRRELTSRTASSISTRPHSFISISLSVKLVRSPREGRTAVAAPAHPTSEGGGGEPNHVPVVLRNA